MVRYQLKIVTHWNRGRSYDKCPKGPSSVSRGRIAASVATLWIALIFSSNSALAAPYCHRQEVLSVCEANTHILTQSFGPHSSVLAAAFGFQAAGSSTITVRTYDAPTGSILSEESFDVNVKEEGAAEYDAHRGRIFAGGIGTDPEGKSRFMLRVYDAETGRFLWEGQLNLLKSPEGGMTRAVAVLVPNKQAMIQTASEVPASFKTLFSVQAVNPTTGRIVWQDQFAPGGRKRVKGEGVLFNLPIVRSMQEPVEHVFDLVVRTYEPMSGTLIWEDSFEQLDRIDDPAIDPEDNALPQAIPSWRSLDFERPGIYRTALR